jgi:hypothetical protein
MVEQPVPGSDLKAMAEVKRAVQPVVLADQGVQTAADVFQIARDSSRRCREYQSSQLWRITGKHRGGSRLRGRCFDLPRRRNGDLSTGRCGAGALHLRYGQRRDALRDR